MAYRWLADATVALHAAFIAFVVLGGFLVWRDVRWALLHVPAVAWVAWLEFTGAICPLTPLENALRTRAGEAGYAGGFIDHYVVPVIYPAGLTPGLQVALGAALVVGNGWIYWHAWRRRRPGNAG
ncbi:MAG: DUF2784 domain-containing protein [Betaproteobacteria bacterium]|nr:DUF2784 domain-containing protein [Betaproteobacteria bacterium]